MKKTPIMPPVFVNGELVSEFKQKANLFNNYLLLNVHLLEMAANYQTLVMKLKKY